MSATVSEAASVCASASVAAVSAAVVDVDVEDAPQPVSPTNAAQVHTAIARLINFFLDFFS